MHESERLAIINESDAVCPCGADPKADRFSHRTASGWFMEVVNGEARVLCPACHGRRERHKPGMAYSCDARTFGGDERLCPIHKAAPDALRYILAVLDDQRSEADMIAAIRKAAEKALGRA